MIHGLCDVTGPVGSERNRSKPMTGELTLVPPLMGSSQRLLNKDHFQVYYEVAHSSWPMAYAYASLWS